MGLDFLVCATDGLSVLNTVGLDVDLSVSSGFGSGFDSGVNILFRFLLEYSVFIFLYQHLLLLKLKHCVHIS